MKCRKCGHQNVDSDWVCSRCEYVLDASFLGNDILNERTRDGIDDEDESAELAPPAPGLEFGGDALILGRFGDADEDVQGIISINTGGFLAVTSEPDAPASVYITSEISKLIVPGRVMRRTADADARKDMLSPFELAVFSLVDGVRNLSDVQIAAGLSHDDLCIAIAMLHDKAIIEALPSTRRPPASGVVAAPALPAPPVTAPPQPAATDAPRPSMAPAAVRPKMSLGAMPQTGSGAVRAQSVKPADDAKQRAAQHYDLCQKDLAAGRVGRAWGYAKLAAEADPSNAAYVQLFADWHKLHGGAHGDKATTPQELMLAAQDAESKGDMERAVEILQRLCKDAPKSAAAYNKLAVLLATRLRRFKPAYDAAIRAVELEPGNMAYQSNMMKILAKVDDVDGSNAAKGRGGGLLGRLLKR